MPLKSSITLIEVPISQLREFKAISIAFLVEDRYDVEHVEYGGMSLAKNTVPVLQPFVKDYDRDAGHGPDFWPQRYPHIPWGAFRAYDGSRPVGGALISGGTPWNDDPSVGEHVAILWDIRVDCGYRQQGIGTTLFAQALAWARQNDFLHLQVETQDVNVATCRFYAGQGCKLTAINPLAYPELPNEVQLLWTIPT